MDKEPKELPKSYSSKDVDEKWYQFWLKHDYFGADAQSRKPAYSIVIPPPNVTGVLHMGHALVNTLQDVLIRWKRMSGFEALWQPGLDHAGIATQTIVEQHLIKTTGKRRKDFSREEFLSHVWDWKEKSEHQILGQLRKLGCSCDWSRLRFTLDEGNNQAVRTVFKKLFDEGLIYRGDYLVNWDPVTQTALADDEVEYEDRDSHLWHFRYPLEDGSGHVVIATTRPETMLGDTAVAVSPKDERYKNLVGKKIRLPLVDRLIPVIEDNYVDPEFGSGVVKITPAHDPNDYQIGLRHDLPFVTMMTPDGHINGNGGRFEGLSMTEGRKAVVEAMDKLGLVEKIEPHSHRVGRSYRSKAIIEPYMSKQWFVNMEGFKTKLRDAVDSDRLKILPQTWVNTYFHWADNLRDWCISRQLWWGHRIPIWYKKSNPEEMICFDGEGQPPEVAAQPDEWVQDEDVLDTWFSSALWPFASLGWPHDESTVKKFYPNSVLVTGHDILFFWVARMIVMGEHVMGELPFPETFLHGLIFGKSYWRDQEGGGIAYVTPEEQKEFDHGKPLPPDVHSKWEKMSKSKGNIIDPLEVIDEYGTDAVRMALCSSATSAAQIDLDRRRFEEFKNFANKVWNGARFVLMNLEEAQDDQLPALSPEAFSEGLDESLLQLEDRWILSILNRTIRDVTKQLEGYQFDQAALQAYDFFWKEFCAYYVEITKPILFGRRGTKEERANKQKLLAIVLTNAVRLLHPMAPFITEELFQVLKERLGGCEVKETADAYTKEALEALAQNACIVAPYPTVVNASHIDAEVNDHFDFVSEVVYTVRNIRGEMNIPPGTRTKIFLIGKEGDSNFESISNHCGIVDALVRAEAIETVTEEPELPFAATGMVGTVKVMIPLPEDLLEKERTRLVGTEEKLSKSLERIMGQLSNENFVQRAPEELVVKTREQKEQMETELEEIRGKLKLMGV